MSAQADALPDDPALLKAIVIAERLESERLRQIIREFQRHRFGRRAESLPEERLELALEDAEQTAAAGQAETEQNNPDERKIRAARRRTNRGKLPAHLPRIETVVDVPSTVCPYGCRACAEAVVQAPAPARLIEGGLPTEATVAHVLVSKFADHLPLYRQAQIYARQGVALDRSTLADWVGHAAFLLRSVHQWLLEKLKASPKLFADETTAPVLDPGRGRTKTGQLFAYARDDRPWGGSDPPGVAYVYAPDRKAEQPIAHLSGFSGILQVDGYGGYKALARRNDLQLAFCWSHVRRKFYELATPGPAPIASEALTRIAELYRIEGEIRGRPAEERRIVRQQRSRPLVEALEPWLRAKLQLISQKTKLAEAIRYALSRWQGLCLFLNDGRVEIDNNVVERSIRPLAMRDSLCSPSLSICKHWKCVGVGSATRAPLLGHRRFDRLRRQVISPDLVRRSGNNLRARRAPALIRRRIVWLVTPNAFAASLMVSHSPFFSADR